MEALNKEHKEKFGVLPIIIGLFLDEPLEVKRGIEKAIKDNKPYSEYEMLSSDEKVSYDNKELVF